MIALLTTALILAAAALAAIVLARDSAMLFRKRDEWEGRLAEIDRDALRDPAAFSLRPTLDTTRGVPVRRSVRGRLTAAA